MADTPAVSVQAQRPRWSSTLWTRHRAATARTKLRERERLVEELAKLHPRQSEREFVGIG